MRPYRSLALLALLLVSLLVGLAPRSAVAHDLRPATLRLVEHEDGRVGIHWTPPVQANAVLEGVQPVYPQHCERLEPSQLDCGQAGLRGTLTIAGLEASSVEVIVQVERPTGAVSITALREQNPSLELGESRTRGARWQLFLAYLGIGVEHIMLGFDHVLFVLGLLFLVGFERKLVWTITAFTLAHSLTLACSVLDILRLPIAPVEAVIALSILLVTAEACDDRPTLTRRAPWAVAFAFGLLHGFGFAGALREIGLPEAQLGLSLFAFNLGVELGQLAIVALCLVVARLLARRSEWATKLRGPALYVMGIVAAYWAIERSAIALGLLT